MAYGKDVEGARPPHWMRSMEEKYQRLHAKIADQAFKFAQSRNSVSVRLRELRQKNYNTMVSTEIDSFPKRERKLPDHSKLEPVCKTHGVKPCPEPDCPVEKKDIDSMNKKRPRTHVATRLGNAAIFPANDTARAQDDVAVRRSSSALASVRIPATSTETSGPKHLAPSSSKHDTSQDLEIVEKAVSGLDRGENNVKDPASSSLQSTKDFTEHSEKLVESGDQKESQETKNSTHDINILASPTSDVAMFKGMVIDKCAQEDSCSTRRHKKCVSGTLSNRKKHPPKSTSNATARKLRDSNMSNNNMRVFGRMSIEAQYAIGETLKEMTSAHAFQNDNMDLSQTPCFQNGEMITPEVPGASDSVGSGCKDLLETTIVSRVDSGHKTTVSTGSNRTRPETEYASGVDNSCLKVQKVDYITKNPEAVICDDDQFRESLPKHSGQKGGQQPERHTTNQHGHFLPYPAPLPAIRQTGYWAQTEDTPFQITSPDFDARFCETTKFQSETDCETPSTDYIRQQAIEKCRLWLEQQLGKL